jgi:hypothetical protein
MPLTINVGLSRKASKDYQSTGVSINITAELDQALLAKPEELQAQVDELYSQAQQAIDRQVESLRETEPRSHVQRRHPPRQDYRPRNQAGGNGRNGGHSTQGPPVMTHSQRRAIESIARRLDVNPAEHIDREFGWVFNDLTLKEASQVIDHLKSLSQSTPTSGGR